MDLHGANPSDTERPIESAPHHDVACPPPHGRALVPFSLKCDLLHLQDAGENAGIHARSADFDYHIYVSLKDDVDSID